MDNFKSIFWICFMFWLFGQEACGIVVPWPGIISTSHALEGKVLTIGPPGKFLNTYCKLRYIWCNGSDSSNALFKLLISFFESKKYVSYYLFYISPLYFGVILHLRVIL